MSGKALVAGVGMIAFSKPGRSEAYDLMGAQAVLAAVADAGVAYDEVQQAYVGYVYADSSAGQAALYHVGMSGVPIVNVNNNCATGSTALFLARQAVESGEVDVALALGFDQMTPGALGFAYGDRTAPLQRVTDEAVRLQGESPAPLAAQLFGGAGADYQSRYGTPDATFGKIAEKARRHAANNPLALFRDPLSLEEIMNSPKLFGPLTRFQACPPTCGAAAAIVVSPAYAKRHGLSGCVEIAAQALTTDRANSFDGDGMIGLVGYDMTVRAASRVYEKAGVGPEDIQVVELHDCFSSNELLSYEALGLTSAGTAERFIEDGDNTYGGRFVVNPSGGLLSKGHPLGATGLAQCYEMVNQVRGKAEARQVEGVRHALQHNLGLGGACVVTLYRAA